MLKAIIKQSGRMKAKYIVLTGSIHLGMSSGNQYGMKVTKFIFFENNNSRSQVTVVFF